MSTEKNKWKIRRVFALPLAITLCFIFAFSGLFLPAAKERFIEKISAESIDHNALNNLSVFFASSITSSAGDLQDMLDNDGHDSYQISDISGLLTLMGMVNKGVSFEGKTLYLTNDIDDSSLGMIYFSAIGEPGKPFTGTFDGNGKKIIITQYNYIGTTNPIGIFGVTSGAQIRNLVADCNLNGAGGQYVGGIAGSAENTVIINCMTISTLSGDAEYVDGIAGEADSASSILNCIYTDGGNITYVHNEAADIIDWSTAPEDDKLEFVKQLNRNVLVLLRDNGFTELLFWGIDASGPVAGADEPVFDEIFMYETMLKEFARSMINFSYLDNTTFITGEDTAADDAKEEIRILYEFYLQELDSTTMAGTSPTDFVDFFDAVREIIDNAIEGFDAIYWDWAAIAKTDEALRYQTKAQDFAFGMIDFSYQDTFLFMVELVGEYSETIEALQAGNYSGNALLAALAEALDGLEAEYNLFLIELDELSMFDEYDEIKNPVGFFDEISDIIDRAIFNFDDMYWVFDETVQEIKCEMFRQEQIDILTEAYDSKMDAVSDAATRNKITQTYTGAVDAINDITFENWSSFAYSLAVAVSNTQADFDRIHAEWEADRIIWIIAIGGGAVLLLVTILLIVFISKNRKKSFIIHSGVYEDRSRNAQLAKERAKLMAQTFAVQREKKDALLEAQRNKALAEAQAQKEKEAVLMQLQREKEEAIAQAQKEKEETLKALAALAKQQKQEALEKVHKEKEDALALAQKHKEELALLAKEKKDAAVLAEQEEAARAEKEKEAAIRKARKDALLVLNTKAFLSGKNKDKEIKDENSDI